MSTTSMFTVYNGLAIIYEFTRSSTHPQQAVFPTADATITREGRQHIS